jgi:hypothetical protein
VKVVLGAVFKRHRLQARRYYAGMSERLVDELDEQVQEIIRVIAKRKGGDHVGPHGHPCRRCRSFPYLVYYRTAGETLYLLGFVHERRHPDYLRGDVGESTE